jgi:hypothetical protein
VAPIRPENDDGLSETRLVCKSYRQQFMPAHRPVGALMFSAVLWLGAMGQAPLPVQSPLDRARAASNAGRYDAAIVAARQAMQSPDVANAAALVLARAHLERFRLESNRDDLTRARETLATVRPAELTPRDDVAFLMSQGLLLYLDGCSEGCFSAAAELFALALARAPAAALGGTERDAIFEWWAGALDRQAQFGQSAERPLIYRRILDGGRLRRGRHRSVGRLRRIPIGSRVAGARRWRRARWRLVGTARPRDPRRAQGRDSLTMPTTVH